MPVGIGGGVNSIEDIHNLLAIGADKVILKNMMIQNPNFLNEAASIYGNQCITIAVDAEKKEGSYFLYNRLNRTIPLFEFINKLTKFRFGEIILTSVNHDGMMDGFDIELVNQVVRMVEVPVVANGGGGQPDHFKDLFARTKIEAVGASSIFYFTQYTPLDVKKAVSSIGKPMRIITKNVITNTDIREI